MTLATAATLGVVAVFATACSRGYRRWVPERAAVERFFVEAGAPEEAGSQGRDGKAREGDDSIILQIQQAAAIEGLKEPDARPGTARHLSDLFLEICKRGSVGKTFSLFTAMKIQGLGHGETVATEEEAHRVALRNTRRLDVLYGEEFDAIEKARSERPWPRYFGLALSGGGIRSASFSTGVLQGLHEIEALDDIGYLSTVSGGGYAASWYLLHGGRFRPQDDPDSVTGQRARGDSELFRPGSLHLRHVTQNGQYLTPGHFSDSYRGLLWSVSVHLICLPAYWVLNGIIDLDLNLPQARRHHRSAIGRAFQYENPCAEGPVLLESRLNTDAKRSMRALLPSGENGLPFWIINMHLSLRDDPTSQHRNRSGDAFELTPCRAGSDAVGYVLVPPLDEVGCGYRGDSTYWMTPSFGTAISAAAADSKSLQDSVVLQTALNLFNLNLGYYVPGWSEGWLDGDRGATWKQVRFYLYSTPLPRWVPGLDALLGEADHSNSQTAKRFAITDGGHFDNLGLYALVRRGCRLIIVADADYDPGIDGWAESDTLQRSRSFTALREVEQKLLSDFGAKLEVDWEAFQVASASRNGSFDSGDTAASGTRDGLLVARIRNLPIAIRPQDGSAGGDPGVTILFLRCAYTQEGGLRRTATFLDEVKANDPGFPNTPTKDQFYTEKRVLAYRELGREIVLANEPRILEELARLAKALGNGS